MKRQHGKLLLTVVHFPPGRRRARRHSDNSIPCWPNKPFSSHTPGGEVPSVRPQSLLFHFVSISWTDCRRVVGQIQSRVFVRTQCVCSERDWRGARSISSGGLVRLLKQMTKRGGAPSGGGGGGGEG